MYKHKDIIIVSIIILLLIIYTYIKLKPTYCEIDPVLEKLRLDLIKVEPRVINLNFFSHDESFTEDKQRVFICLKDPITNEYYDNNTILSVGLHEIAHAFSSVIDKEHVTPEFNNLHNHYRQKAAELKLFDPEFQVSPTYCKK